MNRVICMLLITASWLTYSMLSPSTLSAQADEASEREDVVLMTDGIEWQGRLVDHVPGVHVVLEMNGEHRLIAYAQVFYAGPLAGLSNARARLEESRRAVPRVDVPAPPSPEGRAETEAGPPTDLQEVVTSQRGLTLHLRGELLGGDGRETFYEQQELCAAPCSTRLRRGSHFFVITDEGGHTYRVREPVITNGPGVLSVSVRPRFRVRRALLVTVFGGLAIGAVGFARGLRDIRSEAGGGPLYLPGTVVGIVFGSLALSSGLTMAFGGHRHQRGRVRFRVDPSIPEEDLGTDKERMDRELLRQQRLRDGE